MNESVSYLLNWDLLPPTGGFIVVFIIASTKTHSAKYCLIINNDQNVMPQEENKTYK